ncbi:MAG TPA: tRNA pseudouridine(55) synthase, partial [Candidatus Angelobacter sp.]|nr:tRNA pseudouridine(55) synthase [Candidatus Angelobacter sp.]
ERPVNFGIDQLRDAAKQFVGLIEQLPPPFSAKKIAGIPAYRLARKGQPVELKPRQVEVKELEMVSWDGCRARFKSWVSSGTYLRSLAHDLGQKLGTGAHLTELERTAVREFTLEEAHTLEALEQAATAGSLDELFLHPRLVLPEFPAVSAPPESAAKIRHGGAVNLPEFSKASTVRVFAGQRELLAIARRVAGTLFQPKVVLQG